MSVVRNSAPWYVVQVSRGARRSVLACLAMSLCGCVLVMPGTTVPVVAKAASGAVSPDTSLVGTWRVDLRPTPSAPAYYQSLEIERIEAGRFVGSFYGAPVAEARINPDWGALRIAFVTGDANTAYYHSAVLRDGRLEGLTHAPSRGLLAVWTAEKEKR
jgi:hypothetical protein